MRYFFTDLKLFFRTPLALFFELFFPLMMITIVVGGNGNERIGCARFINYYLPSAIAIGSIPLAFIDFPLWIGKKIEDGSLVRMNYFGISTRSVILADIFSHIIFGLAGIGADIIFSSALFGLRFPGGGYFLSFLLQVFFALITFLVWGAILALAFKNAQTLMAAGLIVMFFLYFCGGIFSPLKNFPNAIQDAAKAFPAHYLPTSLTGVWLGRQYWCWKFLWISAIWLCAGAVLLFAMAIAKRKFSMPRRQGKKR